MSPKYLITGSTGGLGSSVLSTLLTLVPPSQLIAGSSRATSQTQATPGNDSIELRLVDYADLASLATAFADVDVLFFVSAPIYDTETRMRAHRNVVDAVRRSGVKHVYYSSLAFGGLGESEVELMRAHRETEALLRGSGIRWTSVREGIYADAFPVFLNWFPTSEDQVLYLPQYARGGKWAMASRKELGEATAKLMVRGGYEDQVVLLSGPEACTLEEVVEVINEESGRRVSIKWVDEEEYVSYNTANDEGGKAEGFFRAWTSLLRGVEKGDAAEVNPLMEELLGRKPLSGKEFVKDALMTNRDFTWHQNYAKSDSDLTKAPDEKIESEAKRRAEAKTLADAKIRSEAKKG